MDERNPLAGDSWYSDFLLILDSLNASMTA